MNKKTKITQLIKLSRKLFICVLILFLTNCASPITHTESTSLDFSMIEIGSSQKKDVPMLLGLPHKILKHKNNNNEIWIYFDNSVVNRTAYTPSVTTIIDTANITMFLHSSEMEWGDINGKNNVLAILKFNKSNILADIQLKKGDNSEK